MKTLVLPEGVPRIMATEVAQLLTPGYGLSRRQVYERVVNPELRGLGPELPALANCGFLFESAIVGEVLRREGLRLVEQQVGRQVLPVTGRTDALAYDNARGELVVVEAKVVTYLTELKAAYFDWQAEVYSYLFGVQRVVVGVFILSSWDPSFEYWVYTTSPERRERLLLELERFYLDHVLPGVPPVEEERGSVLEVEASEDALSLLSRYAEAARKAKEWEKKAESFKKMLGQAMGTAKRLTYRGSVVAQRLNFKRDIVDTAALREAGLLSAFTKTIDVEQLRIDWLYE